MQNLEHWVWTELIAFDHEKDDCGAGEYLDTLGFVPEGISLLITSPDFVLSHHGMEKEEVLPPDFCSRNGHPGNEVRARQEWTNYELRRMIAALKARGSNVYISMFNGYLLDQFHHEWVSDHPEVRTVFPFYDGDPQGRGTDVLLIKDMADGTPVEDYFIPQLVRCCQDYGLDGFHGADGCTPWWASATECDMSDLFLAQFLKDEWNVPEFMKAPWDGKMTTLQERSRYIWWNLRTEWINFLRKRWTQLWEKLCAQLHAAGLQAVINSTNTRGCFDAIYETGTDYRMLAATGIDAMVVETVALGIELSQVNVHPHDDYPALLREIRHYAPQLKLIFLHGIKDVVENWDNLRHAPAAYERELCRLSNCYVRTESGMERAASGLLGCLADGIQPSEWDFIRSLWKTHENALPLEAGEVVTLHTPSQIEGGIADYSKDGMLSTHDMIKALMEHGLPIETSAALENAKWISGVKLLTSAHLVDPDAVAELATLPGITALMGRHDALKPYFPKGDTLTDGRLALVILHTEKSNTVTTVAAGTTPWKDEELTVSFCRYRQRMDIRDDFWKQAVAMLHEAARLDALRRALPFFDVTGNSDVTIQFQRMTRRKVRVTFENRSVWHRLKGTLTCSMPVESVSRVTAFPMRSALSEDRRTVSLPIPPHGVSVIDIEFKE